MHQQVLAHLNQLTVAFIRVFSFFTDNNSCRLLYLSASYTLGYGIKQIVIECPNMAGNEAKLHTAISSLK
jgi:hypothetical protein